ncbi:CCR4-NOT transcription complex subunit 6-like isoform X2 [Agrilus planipennis]|uniref:CCR4-NOT transcription complex subunit 6-like isoform X2 n=1 Tax=Agrilus planipennis TaxID=224129 RepID=A0A1W4XPJ4_AGRPL|nr:CCR4-NOT transcription complex subunit 6-like isoform X2 [Agrilus planipennis]
MPRNHKENNKNENNGLNRNRNHSVSPEEPTIGKKPQWTELEITGTIRNLSPNLFHLQNLTALYVKNNNLQRLPPDINQLVNLRALDLSCNKLRSLPAELGDLMNLRELLLSHNFLRILPYELGKLFNLIVLGLHGNPLNKDIMTIYSEPNGTHKLLTYMLDNLQGRICLSLFLALPGAYNVQPL